MFNVQWANEKLRIGKIGRSFQSRLATALRNERTIYPEGIKFE